ncbi:CPK28 [Symbiodinium natans]|uniref:CPK28 protein n=1 Tax=Symbiodinium natans TaxID=878477 RepID=A0A812S6H3_9DINO|nr:CPK28 [Symbiodinium natans]
MNVAAVDTWSAWPWNWQWSQGRSGETGFELALVLFLQLLAVESEIASKVSVASPSWFTSQAAWTDVFYLAFLYLDVDCDGLLSADDLSVHLPGGSRARESSHACICKWRVSQEELSPSRSVFLTYSDFQQAVCSAATASCFPPLERRLPSIGTGACDVAWVQRMEAIEEVCRRFAHEEVQ